MASFADLSFFRGRVALCAILRALDIGAGDEVAVQAFTCIAVPEAIMAAGARPLYIDVEPSGVNMDASDLAAKLSPRTRAVVVQHTYGIPADMDRIPLLTAQRGIPVIEDCCHTLASTYGEKTVGRFGIASFYSYEWGKPVVIGIGGTALVNDSSLQSRMQSAYAAYDAPGTAGQLRLELQYLAHRVMYRPSLYWPVRSVFHTLGSLGAAESNYNPVVPGTVAKDFSLRMSALLRKRLIRKLRELPSVTRHARDVATEYRHHIRSQAVDHLSIPEASDTVFARYPLLTHDKVSLLLAARRANVELAEWYCTPVHPLREPEWHLVHYEAGSCPNAETRCQEIVTLPTHPAVSMHDIGRAIRFLNTVSL